MTTKPIKIELSEPELVAVQLGDKTYMAKRPKGMVMVKLAGIEEELEKHPERAQDMMENVVLSIFSKHDGKKIIKRLYDPNDLLDLDHVMQVAEALQGRETTGNPTM